VAGVAPIGDGETSNYSSYSGSLTTPGCMEVVNWINFITPITISSNQLAQFRALKDGGNQDIVDNFRPVQQLNERTVTFYGA
jgi:carbonic anhydrase